MRCGVDTPPVGLLSRWVHVSGISVHSAWEEYEKAKGMLERALSIKEKAYGADHPEVATTLVNFGLLHLTRGNSRAGIPLLIRAWRIFEGTRALPN